MGPKYGNWCHQIVLGLGLFITLFTYTELSQCRAGLCSRHYTHEIESSRIKRGPTFVYCTLLQNYRKCISLTARSCRGELTYHSVSSMLLNWWKDFNCSQLISEGANRHREHHTQLKEEEQEEESGGGPAASDECEYKAHSDTFSHCGVFGDPHLKTFLNEFQTCRVLGAWPLVDNPYLAVQITNERVHKETGATATTKVTVIVRDHSPCTSERTYEAQTDDLPGYFVDGSRGSTSDRHVRIKMNDPGRHIEILIRHIETRIIIRQIGRHLTFAIRMPKEVAMLGSSGDSLELCARGCPKRELIDPNQLMSKPVETWSAGRYDLDGALDVCKQHNVTDFYFDACVFDLLTTGDNSFSLAARQAMKDATSLVPGHTRNSENGWTWVLTGRNGANGLVSVENSAPGRPPRVMLFVFLVWWIYYRI